jgi:hypothetical protein
VTLFDDAPREPQLRVVVGRPAEDLAARVRQRDGERVAEAIRSRRDLTNRFHNTSA